MKTIPIQMKTIPLDPETEFFKGMMRLGFGLDEKKKLKEISDQVNWAKGWPDDKEAFWNAEAFMWGYKIPKTKRELIQRELLFLQGEDKRNLDLGCGAYSYIPSVGFDVSPKMLQFNDNCTEKIVGELEKKLPFSDGSFNSVTAVFVLNYVVNYGLLLKEICRVLTEKGWLVAVLSDKEVNEWQRQKEVNNFDAEKWKEIMQEAGFEVEVFKKEELWFFKGMVKS